MSPALQKTQTLALSAYVLPRMPGESPRETERGLPDVPVLPIEGQLGRKRWNWKFKVELHGEEYVGSTRGEP
jgi:hypothetical protein